MKISVVVVTVNMVKDGKNAVLYGYGTCTQKALLDADTEIRVLEDNGYTIKTIRGKTRTYVIPDNWRYYEENTVEN